jgi:hypothetical protein
MWMDGWIKQSYNLNLKLILNNNAVKKKYDTIRKLRVSETNIQRWRQHKEKLINTNKTGKYSKLKILLCVHW